MNDIEFLKFQNSLKRTTRPEPLVSRFISRSRIMPPGTPFPGPVDLTLTPYAIEWMDNMSPYSPVQHQAILKAAQIAATFAIECIIGYWMREMPTAIMYLSATQDLLEKWGTKRLEPMIDSIGMREKIIEHAETHFGKRSRRTGDKVFSKQFVGGFLEMASAQSPASQRSDSIRVMIRDEIDGAPSQLTTGEGNWLNTSAARTKFWGDRKKITDLSTPTLYDTSNIYPEYESGDKRLYTVPCPHCGKFQALYWLPEDGNHGLRADTVAGQIVDAYYLCEFCHDAIRDTSKKSMFNAGKWEPTATSWSNTFRSYYINSLYSPPRTVSWKDYYIEWQNSRKDPDKDRGFTNLYGGMPYQETGERPSIKHVNKWRGVYKPGDIPNGVLYLTAAVDVQRGSATDEKNPPRLELQLVGHGYGYKLWSVDYQVFTGGIKDIYSGAWEKLRAYMADTTDGLRFRRMDGREVGCKMVLIDSGDGENMSQVYQFCEPFPAVYPCKGFGSITQRKGDKGDPLTDNTFMRYRIKNIGKGQSLFEVSTNFYKRHIYSKLNNIERHADKNIKNGFIDFADYPDKYFDMLTAEEMRTDGSFSAGGRRNEALDTLVYAIAAGEAWLDQRVDGRRKELKKNGASDLQAATVTHKVILNLLQMNIDKGHAVG